MDDPSALAESCSCSVLCDYFLQILACADIATDVMLIFKYVTEAPWRSCEALFEEERCDIGDAVAVTGFSLWTIHLWARITCEGASFIEAKHQNIPPWAKWILWMFGPYCLLGCFVFIEKILRVALAPLDPLLAIGYYSSTQKWTGVIVSNFFLITRHEKPYFETLSVPLRYLNTLSNAMAGGRWKVRPLLEESFEHSENEGAIKRVRAVIAMAIVEEVFENVGGVTMAAGLAMMEGFSTLTTVSLVTTIASAIVETGKYVGDFSKIGKETALRKEKNNPTQTTTRQSNINTSSCSSGQTSQFFSVPNAPPARTSMTINTNGTVTVLEERTHLDGSAVTIRKTYPNFEAAAADGIDANLFARV